MENKHPINDVMGITMDKVREMVDVNTIVGEPIHTPEGVTVIPVSKVSIGFASGGADYAVKSNGGFGGGSGAGVSIDPVAFLIIRPDSVRLLPVAPLPGGPVEKVIDMMPELVDKVTAFIDQKKEEKALKKAEAEAAEAAESAEQAE